MPNLREYIRVGICSGYGDGDFGVSVAVSDLSREQLDELKLATLTALRVADDMWLRGQEAEQPKANDATQNEISCA